MKRRDLLGLMGASLALSALPAWGQKRIPRVVWFSYGDARSVEGFLAAFTKGMQQQGYVSGKNIVIDVVMGNFSQEKTHQQAAELVANPPDVIVTQGFAVRAVMQRTKTIPIVAGFSGDMVEAKLVASHARPASNVTGVQFLSLDLVGKRLELLKELQPKIERVAVIADPGHAGLNAERAAAKAAADKLRIQMDFYPVKTQPELDTALETARLAGAQAIVAFPDSVTNAGRQRIADYAIKHRLPSISGWDSYAEAGFLAMYGPNLKACWSRLAYHVDRILRGANPAELPVEMPTTVEEIVNLKTAKALGIDVPQHLLLRADRVIE